MAIEDLKYNKLTSKIIGLAMKVHRTLGNGFQELPPCRHCEEADTRKATKQSNDAAVLDCFVAYEQ